MIQFLTKRLIGTAMLLSIFLHPTKAQEDSLHQKQNGFYKFVVEFNISMDYRFQTSNESLSNSWDTLTPSDARGFREDAFNTPAYLGLYYSPHKNFSIGAFLERNVYKMRDKKENDLDDAQAPVNVFYRPHPSYDAQLRSQYKLKFNPVILGLSARLNLPFKSNLITVQYKVGTSRLFDSKYKFTRINELQEVYDTWWFGTKLIKPVKTTHLKLTGKGDFHSVVLGYYRNLGKTENAKLGVEASWQQSVIKEIHYSVSKHDDSIPGFSVDQFGAPLPYPSFVEGEVGILHDDTNEIPTTLDYGGFSVRLTYRIYIIHSR